MGESIFLDRGSHFAGIDPLRHAIEQPVLFDHLVQVLYMDRVNMNSQANLALSCLRIHLEREASSFSTIDVIRPCGTTTSSKLDPNVGRCCWRWRHNDVPVSSA